jgi:hypothetical protein
METRPKNPNAFPADTVGETYSGMSLRDYFATAAMQGLTAKYGETRQVSYDSRAKESYKIADAMLKAREL